MCRETLIFLLQCTVIERVHKCVCVRTSVCVCVCVGDEMQCCMVRARQTHKAGDVQNEKGQLVFRESESERESERE